MGLLWFFHCHDWRNGLTHTHPHAGIAGLLQVEEGVCQLLSYLFLKYKQVVADDSSPKMRATFRARLRAVLVQQIETDQTPVYGDGFRAALEAYTRVHSLQTVFDSLRRSGRFP